jgi:hypothetical protein
MRRVTFDYPNTCPKIDREINRAQAAIESFIDGLLDEASPLLEAPHRRRLAQEYAARLYDEELEGIFESTRSENEEMRKEAETQIARLHDEIDSLSAELEQAR